ncbi:MAG: PQQ-dependent sugar dehydrogenase [Verrucomicrobiota bacterium]
MKKKLVALALITFSNFSFSAETPSPIAASTNSLFRKVVLDADQEVNGQAVDTLIDPMELAIAGDGRVFYAERAGVVKMWDAKTKRVAAMGKLNVFTNLEDGLLGITLDPNFLKNGWIYLYHSLPETGADENGQKAGTNRLSRFTLKNESLDLTSEKPLLNVRTQREQCCHAGGSLSFDAEGNLYLSTGDNTNPFESDGYAPIDERPGRSPWDAQKSSANANDLRGKILRIHPEKNGTHTIPNGNLFKPGTPKTRPEIFVMGNRNPFRISVDPKNGFLYWGEVGPDAGVANESRGPAGFDEINQARTAGNFGWPYLIGDNKRYWHWDFAAKTNTFQYDPAKPINTSPNNTGIQELPPAQPSLIYYPSGASTKFPVVKSGGRTAMAGPVYYFSKKLNSPHKLPETFDHTLFIYEWSRNWIIAVHLGQDEKIQKMEPFCAELDFKRPMDIELGPDGCLYVIEWGTAWGNNKDTKIIRLEYTANEK